MRYQAVDGESPRRRIYVGVDDLFVHHVELGVGGHLRTESGDRGERSVPRHLGRTYRAREVRQDQRLPPRIGASVQKPPEIGGPDEDGQGSPPQRTKHVAPGEVRRLSRRGAGQPGERQTCHDSSPQIDRQARCRERRPPHRFRGARVDQHRHQPQRSERRGAGGPGAATGSLVRRRDDQPENGAGNQERHQRAEDGQADGPVPQPLDEIGGQPSWRGPHHSLGQGERRKRDGRRQSVYEGHRPRDHGGSDQAGGGSQPPGLHLARIGPTTC